MSFMSFWSFLQADTQETHRVYAHLLVRDPFAAVQEAKKGLLLFPESKPLQVALIRSLCESGDESEALEEWKRAVDQFQIDPQDRHLLETLAWGVLSKGEHSSQISIRMNALIGACITHDARAIPLLLAEMQGSSALLRAVAVKLSATFGDAPLQEELERLFKKEKVWYVRLEVIKAVGQLQMKKMKSSLKEMIGHPKTLLEEKALAILSLVNMYDEISAEDLRHLIKSDRAGLRQLACDIIAHLEMQERAEDLVLLLKDRSPDVRLSALNALGLLGIESFKEKPLFSWIADNLNDPAPEVAITAAWLALLLNERAGEEKLASWMRGSEPERRRLASAALSVTGKAGIPLAVKMLQESDDPYVKANIALGLIGLRHESKRACDVLYALISQNTQQMWMWENGANPLFRSLAPSEVRHIEQIPHYPLVVDQLVKLDILSILSIMRHPAALDAVKGFLQKQTWGVSGSAAATLLEEGNEQALGIVRELLKDSDEKIRVQAALILAILGSDTSAVKVLQEAYPKMEREMKIHILEAIGHIGDRESIPFLIQILKEPFQVLRVVAASALIQCLYH